MPALTQAVILAGGLGSRLRELSNFRPKPMQLIDEIPFLEILIWNLKRYGFTSILLSIGHLAHVIKDYFGDGSDFGINIVYVEEIEPSGTAGALFLCEQQLEDYFLFLNGDTLFDINFDDLGLLLLDTPQIAALALHFLDDVSRYGSVELDKSVVLNFSEKMSGGTGLVGGGVSVFKKDIVKYIEKIPSSLENDVLPKLVSSGLVLGKQYDGFFIDIGLPESLLNAQTLVPKWRQKHALFLDCNVVLKINDENFWDIEQLNWVVDAIDAIKAANDAGVLVFIIANRFSAKHGKHSEARFYQFMKKINSILRTHGGHLDKWYHYPQNSNDDVCYDCAKGCLGLIDHIIAEWNLKKASCIIVGNSQSNIDTVNSVGISSVIFDHTKDNLLEIVHQEVLSRTFFRDDKGLQI